MRTISGGRNRLTLLIGGLLFIAVGGWGASAATSLRNTWQGGSHILPDPQHTLIAAAAGYTRLLPVAFGASVLVVILGCLLLAAQIPKAPAAATLRVVDADGRLLGSIEPKVFERALQETAESISGVLGSAVHFGGSTQNPWLQAELEVAEGAQLEWAVKAVRAGLAEAVTMALGHPPARLDLQVSIGT